MLLAAIGACGSIVVCAIGAHQFIRTPHKRDGLVVFSLGLAILAFVQAVTILGSWSSGRDIGSAWTPEPADEGYSRGATRAAATWAADRAWMETQAAATQVAP